MSDPIAQNTNDLKDIQALVISELSQIAESTDYAEDTLESIQKEYAGKSVELVDYSTAPSKIWGPYSLSIEFKHPTVVAVITGINKPIRIAEFRKIIASPKRTLRLVEVSPS